MALAVVKIAGAQCPIAAVKSDDSSSELTVGYPTTRFFDDDQPDISVSIPIVDLSTHAGWHVVCDCGVAPAESVDEGKEWLLHRLSALPGRTRSTDFKTPGSTKMPTYSSANGPEKVPTESTNQSDLPRNGASGGYCEFLAATFLVNLSSRHDEETSIYDPMVNQVKLIGELLTSDPPADLTATNPPSVDATTDVESRAADNDANSSPL